MLGKLNFASAVVPDFKRRVKCIERLQRADVAHVWTRKHTDALNDIVELVWRRLVLHVPDLTKPLHLHVDFDSTDCCVVCTQEVEGSVRLLAMVGRETPRSERWLGGITRALLVALWGIRRLHRWTAWATAIVIHLPDKAHVAVCRGKELHLRL